MLLRWSLASAGLEADKQLASEPFLGFLLLIILLAGGCVFVDPLDALLLQLLLEALLGAHHLSEDNARFNTALSLSEIYLLTSHQQNVRFSPM